MNPFKMRPERTGDLFVDWEKFWVKPYNKNEVNPYTRTRIILMNGTEFENVWFSHQFSRSVGDDELRRKLAYIRKSEQQQQKILTHLKPADESALEHTIGYEQLAVDLTAHLAKYDIIEKVYGFESEPKLITSFIKEMVKLGYAAEMNEIFEAYYRYWDEKNHIIRAELISAEAATDEEANDAKALLQSKYPEYEISLTQKVDETLLGGYVIKTLNTEYDRSYEGKLRELERKLTRR